MDQPTLMNGLGNQLVQWDWTNTFRLFCFGWGLVLLLFWPRSSFRSGLAGWGEALGGLLMIGALLGADITSNAWLQWGLLSLASWILWLILSQSRNQAESDSKSVGQCLIWLSIADCLWLVGLAGLESLIGTAEISLLTNVELISALTGGARALAVLACTFLMAGLLIRSGLFPFMTWSGTAAKTFQQAGWVTLGGLGSGAVLLFRWEPLLTGFAETRLLLAGMGGLTAVLLPVMAWAQSSVPGRLALIASAQLGLCCLGLAAGGPAPIFLHWGMGSLLLTLFFAKGIGLKTANRGKPANIVLFATGGWLCLGGGGLETLLEALQARPLPGAPPVWLLVGGVLFGQGLAAFVLFRLIFSSNPQEAGAVTSTPSPNWRAWLWGFVGTVAVLGAPYLFRQELWTWPLLSGILVAIGAVMTALWPETIAEPGTTVPEGTWRRLGRSEFSIPVFWRFGIVAPCEALAAISWHLERRFFRPWMQETPSLVCEEISEIASQQEEETSPYAAVKILLATAAIMLIAVLLTG